MKRTPACRGFTLIEVRVALAIVAIALLACVKAMGSMHQGHAALSQRMLAQVSAQNVLAELYAGRKFPQIGVQSAPCPQGRAQFACRVETSATANPAFRRVRVTVRLPGSDAVNLAVLDGVMPRLP